MRRTGLAIAAAAALCASAVPAWSDGEQKQPPVAELSVSPQPVVAGEGAVLDGAASRDPDGSIASYAWDLDGDGAFERVMGAEPRLAHVFEQAGTHTVGLRVVDDSGESADATRQVEVAAPPEPEPQPAPEPEPAAKPDPNAGSQPKAATAEPRASTEADAPAPQRKPKADSSRIQAAASTTVSIRDFSFAPKTVTVSPGDTVTWRNTGDEPHTATGSGFDTGTLQSGQSGSHTFNQAGSFSYKCQPHPFMTGTVRVVASGSGGGSGGGTQGAQNDGTAGGTGGDSNASASGGDGSLPSTGLALGSVVLTGLAMIAAGVMLRRRVAWPGA